MRVVQLAKEINKKPILSDICFELHVGEITGLIGRNGSGKTTLFRTINNIYQKDTGEIFINQQSIDENPNLREHIFYLDERYNFLSNQTLKKIALYYQHFYSNFDFEKFNSLLAKYNLDASMKLNQHSKGNQALFKMILAFSCRCRFYLFDEPFDGLDVIVKKKVISLLLHEVSFNQCGIVISSHNLQELESLIDHAIILHEGIIYKDFDLVNIKNVTKKFQMVFQKKEIPGIIKKNCQIIQVQGRVLVGVFEKMTDDLYEDILALEPVLFEEVPLTLEDIFSSHFTNESDYQLFQ